MRKSAPRLAAAAALAVVTVQAAPAPATGGRIAADTSAVTDTVAEQECVPLPITNVDFIDGNGRRSSVYSANSAIAYHYGVGNAVTDSRSNGVNASVLPSTDLEQVVPPIGFQPANASDTTLKAFGFPPRPAGGVGRKAWDAQFGQVKIDTSPAPGVCVNGGISHAATTSANWSGLVNKATTYNSVSGSVYTPTFTTTTCGSSAASDAWVGLGGATSGSTKLIQTGLNSVGASTDSYGWFEMINGSYDSGEIRMNGVTTTAGFLNHLMLWYDTDSSGKSRVSFLVVTNQNNGGPYTPYRFTTYGGYNASTFNDHTSAEFINERPTVASTGRLAPLKQFNNYHWTNVFTATSNDTITMKNSGGSTIAGLDYGMTSSTEYTNYWHRCS